MRSASLLEQRLAPELERLKAGNLYRVRRVVEGAHGAQITVNGKACINFCSNDYLGLASDPRIATAARKALSETGTGSGAAALVSGYNREHCALEEELAAYTGRARALLFSTGWAANLGVLRALLGKNDTLIADELNHASLIDGGRLSGATYVRVPHLGVDEYQNALASAKGNVIVATDSVFSMDGDLASLPALAELCRTHKATLMVDDAHGFGVREIPQQAEIYVATLGKSLGCAGAFVAGSETLIEYLIQRARSWVFSTAPPPALAAAARESLRIIQSEPALRQQLETNILRFRDGARQLGIVLKDSTTAIQPLIVGEEKTALALSQYLFERGLWVAAIRPPTVPASTSRLRITLSAAHASEQIDRLLAVLSQGLKC
ncbi:MAG: 8-amino-7-oxononanoate synthase [Pseudomonadota bacterium]